MISMTSCTILIVVGIVAGIIVGICLGIKFSQTDDV